MRLAVRQCGAELLGRCVKDLPEGRSLVSGSANEIAARRIDEALAEMGIRGTSEIVSVSLTAESVEVYRRMREQKQEFMQLGSFGWDHINFEEKDLQPDCWGGGGRPLHEVFSPKDVPRESEQNQEGDKFCRFCGTKRETLAKYCAACGRRFGSGIGGN